MIIWLLGLTTKPFFVVDMAKRGKRPGLSRRMNILQMHFFLASNSFSSKCLFARLLTCISRMLLVWKSTRRRSANPTPRCKGSQSLEQARVIWGIGWRTREEILVAKCKRFATKRLRLWETDPHCDISTKICPQIDSDALLTKLGESAGLQ